MLALRSDMTIPIARLVATRFADAEPPLRFCYLSHAYRAVRPQRGQQREFLQAGIELIGADAPEGTVEVLEVLCAALDAAGLPRARIGLGDAGLFRSLLRGAWASSPTARGRVLDGARAARLRGAGGARSARSASASAGAIRSSRLPQLRGGAEVIERAVELGGDDVASADVAAARDGRRASSSAGIADRVIFDLGLVRDLGYYTRRDLRGLRPRARARDRRRRPLRRPARRASAARCRRAASRCTWSGCTSRRPRRSAVARSRSARERGPMSEPLRLAVPRGALFGDTLDLLDRIGVDTSPLRSDSRSLLFPGEEVTLVTMRPSDVPTYVEAGAVDLGITGKDVLMEQQERVVYELLDLGYGHCRMVVATRAGNHFADELERRLGAIRIATKYPRVAARYFEQSGRQAEVIEVKGSVELAPLVGPRRRHRRPDRDGPHAAGERPRDPRGDRRLHGAAGREPRRAQAAAGGDRRARGADRCALSGSALRARARADAGARRWRERCARWRPRRPTLRRRGARRSCAVVRERGDEAVLELTPPLRQRGAPRTTARAAGAARGRRSQELDPAVRAGLELAVDERAARSCEAEPRGDVSRRAAAGAARSRCASCRCGRAGVYVPGGRAAYPSSSVVMCCVPARVAGVEQDRGRDAARARRRAEPGRSWPPARSAASTRST